MERATARSLLAKPYLDNVNWTKGIDQKTGKPLDYDPNKDIQIYAGRRQPDARRAAPRRCARRMSGGNNFWPSSYSPKTKLHLHPGADRLRRRSRIDPEHAPTRRATGSGGAYKPIERYESNLTAVDPLTGEIKKNVHLPYPNYSGTLVDRAAGSSSPGFSTAPSRPIDDTTLEQLWKINVGTGFDAPPMTFEVNGKQYVAILSGLSRDRARQASAHPGAQGAAQRDHAVRVRAVMAGMKSISKLSSPGSTGRSSTRGRSIVATALVFHDTTHGLTGCPLSRA